MESYRQVNLPRHTPPPAPLTQEPPGARPARSGRRAAFWVLAAFVLAGCATDAVSASAADAESAGEGAGDAPTGATLDAAADADDQPVFTEPLPGDVHVTFSEHINPILTVYCGYCHTANAESACLGRTCFVDQYPLTQLPGCCSKDSPFGVCRGEGASVTGLLAACFLSRVESTLAGGEKGKLLTPKGPILMAPNDVEVLRRWVEDGAPP